MARISKAELIRLQKKHRRDQAIGDLYGITRQAVHQLRKKYGVSSVIADNPSRNKQIREQYKGGKSVSAIAKKNKLSISYTYRIIAESKRTKAKKK